MKEVTVDTGQLYGIGVQEVRENSSATGSRQSQNETVLKDPMTNEIISTVPVYNADGIQRLDGMGRPVFQVNDHWFVLNLKFIWKDAPEPPQQTSTAPSSNEVLLYR